MELTKSSRSDDCLYSCSRLPLFTIYIICVYVCVYVCMYVCAIEGGKNFGKQKNNKLIVGERRIEDCESQKPLKMVQTR